MFKRVLSTKQGQESLHLVYKTNTDWISFGSWLNCDPLSQNEHKVARVTFWNYYRFQIFIKWALKWCMTWRYSSLFWSTKTSILGSFSFVFYCSVACLTGYIFACNTATLRSFCSSRSQLLALGDSKTMVCPKCSWQA